MSLVLHLRLQGVGITRLVDKKEHNFELGFWCPADVEIHDNLSVDGAYIMVFGNRQKIAKMDSFQSAVSAKEKKGNIVALAKGALAKKRAPGKNERYSK